MASSSQQVAALQEGLRQMLLDKLTDALLQCSSVGHLDTPVLRLEAFIQEGYDGEPGITNRQSPSRRPILSVSTPRQ